MTSSADMTDRISQLPDELLISIMSHNLTMKEATATSILSKQWKTLWTYYYGFLDFDDEYKSRLLKTTFDSVRISGRPVHGQRLGYHECSSKYFDHVNKVLNSHQGFVPIRKLRICWSRGYLERKTVIDSWIYFVMKNGVQHFELDWPWGARYKLPPLMTLMGTTGIGFPNLCVLRLCCVDLTDEDLGYLLSSDKCPLLQHISIDFAPSLVHVKVVGTLNLKSLEFTRCWYLKDVEISSAVNMVSFEFEGLDSTTITFENAPLITEAFFGGSYWKNVVKIPIAPQLWSILSQLEILRLDLTTFSFFYFFQTSQFPTFDRVKCLEIRAHTPNAGDLNKYVMAMIYGCPRLQKFSLKMIYNRKADDDPDGDDSGYLRGYQDIFYEHQHECLQAVEYEGWRGNEDDLELITDILNISVVLDKLTIDPRTKLSSKEQELQLTSEREFLFLCRENFAREAAERLQAILPHKVSLVIL